MILSIDPGMNRLGWALWSPKGKLRDYGLVSGRDLGATSWEGTTLKVVGRVARLISSRGVSTIVCEMPEEFGSRKGKAALASGSVRKLAYLVGAIGGRAQGFGVEFFPVEVMIWKGNVPKEITRKRVLRDWGDRFPGLRSAVLDITDAVGVGRWYFSPRGRKRIEERRWDGDSRD